MEKAFKKMAQVFGYPSREYKDRVFRMLLKEPKVALEVYNATAGVADSNCQRYFVQWGKCAKYIINVTSYAKSNNELGKNVINEKITANICLSKMRENLLCYL